MKSRTLVRSILILFALVAVLPTAFAAEEEAPAEQGQQGRDPASKHKHGKKKHHKKKHGKK